MIIFDENLVPTTIPSLYLLRIAAFHFVTLSFSLRTHKHIATCVSSIKYLHFRPINDESDD